MNFYLSSLDLNKIIIRSVFAILLGAFFCFFPSLTARLIVVVLGGAILFVGIVSFLSVFATKNQKPVGIHYFNLALSLIVGLMLLISPGFFVSLIMILLGIILIISSIGQLSSLWSVRKWGIKPNPVEYLLGLLLLALGIFICFKPGFGEKTIFTLFGIGYLLYGLTDLIVHLRLRDKLKKAGKTIVHGNIEDVDYEIEDFKEN